MKGIVLTYSHEDLTKGQLHGKKYLRSYCHSGNLEILGLFVETQASFRDLGNNTDFTQKQTELLLSKYSYYNLMLF